MSSFPQKLAHDFSPFTFQSKSQGITTLSTTPLSNNSVNENSYSTDTRRSSGEVVSMNLIKNPLPWESLKNKKKKFSFQ